MSENNGIYSKLLKIQTELKAPKSQYNSFGKYNYRNCEDILEAVKPLCEKYGVAITISDDIAVVGDRYYVRAVATARNIENGFETSVTAYAREEENKKGMDGSQVTGASSSYARKYALGGLLLIDDNKDSDTTNNGQNAPENKPKEKSEPLVDKDKIGVLEDAIADYNLATGKGASIEKICTKYGISKIEEMTVKDWKSAVDGFNKAAKEAMEQVPEV